MAFVATVIVGLRVNDISTAWGIEQLANRLQVTMRYLLTLADDDPQRFISPFFRPWQYGLEMRLCAIVTP